MGEVRRMQRWRHAGGALYGRGLAPRVHSEAAKPALSLQLRRLVAHPPNAFVPNGPSQARANTRESRLHWVADPRRPASMGRLRALHATKHAPRESSVHARPVLGHFRALRRLQALALATCAGLGGCYGLDPADRAALDGDAGLARPVVGTGVAMDAGAGNRVLGDGAVAVPPAGDAGSTPGGDAGMGADAGLFAPNDAGGGGYLDADSGVWVYPLLPNVSCREPYTDSLRNHDVDYDNSSVHGLDAVLAGSDCRSCHGDALEGCARAPSCNNCHNQGHQDGWQTNCTYCHGAGDNDTGAPPRFLDDNDLDRPANTFLLHSEHVSAGDHPAYDCVQCHVKPQNALSKGHMFDLASETPGVAEVLFSGGLSKSGAFANGTCSNLYCHGTGVKNGSIAHTATSMSCTSCHGDRKVTSATAPLALSGAHIKHLTTTDYASMTCGDCHGDVVSQDTVIIGPARHVDGTKDVKMPSGVTMDMSGKVTCTGACHGWTHGLFYPVQPNPTWL